MRPPPCHPLEDQPSFVAVVDAVPPLALLAARLAAPAMVRSLAYACGDLADGFAAPPHSRRRIEAHRRAWTSLRAIDRAVGEAARTRRAPGDIVRRAQRAIDRADVLVGSLLP